jgi:hypothetical protein
LEGFSVTPAIEAIIIFYELFRLTQMIIKRAVYYDLFSIIAATGNIKK